MKHFKTMQICVVIFLTTLTLTQCSSDKTSYRNAIIIYNNGDIDTLNLMVKLHSNDVVSSTHSFSDGCISQSYSVRDMVCGVRSIQYLLNTNETLRRY